MSPQLDRFDFGSVAGSYDEWYKTRRGRAYDVLEKKAVEQILPDPMNANRLLDVGCGTGHWSAFFSEHGFVVNGVDISPEMIAVAREKRIANVSFDVADAHRLPFEDGRFDVAAAITALEFVRNAKAVIHEMVRCTRHPGGILLVGVLNALAGVNVRRKAEQQPPYAEARFFSPAELKTILAPYGTVRVTVTTFIPNATWALPLAPLTDLVGRTLHNRYGSFVVGEVRL